MKDLNKFLRAALIVAFLALPGSNALARTVRTVSPGVYDLNFEVYSNGVYTTVSSLPVMSQELILRAYVEDSDGVPAQSGTATFEYCSYKGLPTGDIERADEAPRVACDRKLN